jgi:peptide methionine sulfoxide reductase msrA/msrB
MNGTRVRSDDTSRLSLGIGLGVAVLLIAAVVFLVVLGHSKMQDVIGFDPNRPVPSDAVLRARLKPEQYRVVRENATETPFNNPYWNNERKGIYADIITGEPLFTSLDKVDSATGRLTFTKPISKDLIVQKADTSHDMQRTEVRVRRSDAHLGHVFADPTSPTGERYAVNSASFHFVPVEKMEAEGYANYVQLLDQKK